jgi:ADP-ribosyl-[dinitrogen reductase] hydrolase
MMDDYRSALDLAIEVAREAGDLLRRELLKSGGPECYSFDHTRADEEAEQLIRRRLMEWSPDGWGYLGEETSGQPAQMRDGHCHLWTVDPNDGTRWYCAGWRGSATSIALLRGGIPVLGVVHAFAAPDNAGDLFAWAEGCGPLQRNSRPVERRPWETTVTAGTIVLLSPAAEQRAPANLECVVPGRYLVPASIAYRLALVAAGDGEVGVALGDCVTWDYVGGHALLRASSGVLLDEKLEPITYDLINGSSSARRCVGGGRETAEEIGRRPWEQALRTPKAAPEAYDLCVPRPGETIDDERLLRVQGCWLGQLSGDALGSMVEFASGADLRQRYPNGLREIGPSPVWNSLAGQSTDDSELALILARTLLRDGQYDAERVAAGYLFWRNSGPFDVGNTIGAATNGIRVADERGEGLVAGARRHANQDSQANGALMRQSPLAIWGHKFPAKQLDEVVRADTALTHPNRVCQDASAAFVIALAAVIREGLDGAGAHKRAMAWDREHGQSPGVTQALEDACERASDFEGNAGWVLVALQNAFYQALHAETFEEGVVATVMSGGDTDTNGAIAGALLGAIHGASAIPLQWREAVLSCRPQRGAPGVLQPRPRAFWPVDALILSERLAVTARDQAPYQ